MRWLPCCLLILIAVTATCATAQEATPDNIVQEYSGSGSTTTALFKVQNHWEVRWNARQVVSVAVMSPDGAIVTGAAGVLRGSLFVPLGGQYYLKINDGTDSPATPAPGTPSAQTNAAPPAAPDTNTPVAATAADSTVNWHVQVLQVPDSVNSDQALTVYTPYFTPPDSAITPAPQPPPPPVLTAEQAQTLVTIKGDNAQGNGFLITTPDGTYVATHLHLLAANPNLQISANGDTPLTILSIKAATDRDLALIAIKETLPNTLPYAPDTKFDTGDQLIIPDVGAHTDTLIGKPGRIIGLSQLHLDFDNRLRPGDDGVPVIHVKSGHVLALVSPVKNVDLSNFIAQNWTANPAPGSSGVFPYYGLRLDGTKDWQTIDPARFLAETTLLKNFHHDTRCLDSYLNGHRRREFDNAYDIGLPDYQYYLNSPQLRAAINGYKHLADEADRDQRLDATRELLSDLYTIAGTGLDTLQNNAAFYAYDKNRAREEITYRLALKKELDDLSSNLGRLDDIATSH